MRGEFDTKRERTNTTRIDEELANLRIIMDPEEAREFVTQLGNQSVALDFETTGLSPIDSRVRLSCIYHPDVGPVLLDHMFCGTFNELVHFMLGPLWLVYNAKFEYRWFEHGMKSLGMQGLHMMDVDFLDKAKRGGSPSSLARMAKRDLGIVLDKAEQLSVWS